MKSLTKHSLTALVAAAMAVPAVTSSSQTVLFDFNNGGVANAAEGSGVFDQGELGDTATVGGLVATVVDIQAPVFDDAFALTGEFISAAAGDGGLQLNINGSSSLGIASPALPNGVFGSETDVLNAGESFTLSFNEAVEFTAIELEGVATGDLFNVSVGGVSVIAGAATEGNQALGGLDGLIIAAGDTITFGVDGTLAGTSLAIETFTVNIIPDGPVIPEPASLALMALGGLAIGARRKRR